MSKTIFRKAKSPEHPYVMISKSVITDINLSLKAKGLMCFLLGLPDDWSINLTDIAKRNSDGITTIRNITNELIRAGYIQRERKRTNQGKFEKTTYIVHEGLEKPDLGKPHADKPHVEDLTLLSNKRTNNKKTNTHEVSCVLTSEDSFDLKLAKRFKNAIDVNKKASDRKASLANITKQLQLIRIKNDYKKKYFKSIILWYIDNINDRYTPKIYRAQDITAKFSRIVDAMIRNVGEPPVPLSKQAKSIIRSIRNEEFWSEEHEDDLKQIVQLSLGKYTAYGKANKKLIDCKILKVRSLALKISKCCDFTDEDYFMKYSWMILVCNSIRRKQKVNIQDYVFDVSSKEFMNLVKTTLGCGIGKETWSKYVRMIKKAQT